MKRFLCTIAIILMLAGLAYAGAISDGDIKVSSTATGISSPDAGSKRALITVSGDTIRYSFKTSPTVGNGHLMYDGDSLLLDNYRDISAIKFIGTGTSSIHYTIFDR